MLELIPRILRTARHLFAPSKVSRELARLVLAMVMGEQHAGSRLGYDDIIDFYLKQVGSEAPIDAVARATLAMTGDVAGSRVLDLACAEGRVTRELARRGATAVGVDVSAGLVALGREMEARTPLGVTYVVGDATSVGWWDGTVFDAVVCNHGLADIDDLDAALNVVRRVLRPGGLLVFSILHPCCPGAGPTTPSAWPPDRGYGTEGWWLADNPGFRGKVGSTFRRLSTYLNGLIANGLTIVEVGEPESAAIPMFLTVRSRRA